ncbi:MAG: hypothetical protein ACLQAR_00935 [Steroidobacteraceae bacterium]
MPKPVRPEIRWAITAAVALTLGVSFAEPYARLMAPYDAAIARLIAANHPWQVDTVEVKTGESGLSAELQLGGYVRRHREDPRPAARVLGRVVVGEVIETPLLFWTLLLMWPAASLGQRAARVLVGVPVYLGLEAVTTAVQLILPMAQATAILGGNNDAVTAWDHWTRFLEAGGQFVIVCGSAMIVCASTSRRPFCSIDERSYLS